MQIVNGYSIEFHTQPYQSKIPRQYQFESDKTTKINREVRNMCNKGIIEKIPDNQARFVSNIFTRPKSDNTLRIILDLTELNEFVTYKHFKMDNLPTAIDLMSPGCYMASVDWKDAYYSVPITSRMRNYLAFRWGDQMYQFTCIPNGLSSGPRVFTRLTKILFSDLRKQGYLSTSYIDDCLLFGRSKEACQENLEKTVKLSIQAGFIVHPDKSVLAPTQKITYLGFWLDSKNMTVKLTEQKATKLKSDCLKILGEQDVTIKNLARVIGSMVATFPGVPYGQLFYRLCDNHKSKALKEHKGNFGASTVLPSECKHDLKWWAENIETVSKKVLTQKPTIVIETDASLKGWGACVKDNKDLSTGGHWSKSEAAEHINYLELLAVWFGIQCFCDSLHNKHIKILSDNTTAVAYLNSQGGTKAKCNTIARKIWLWAYHNDNFISAAHLPGAQNFRADKESRSIHDNMEWKLDPSLFQRICQQFGTPEIDLFATRLNKQVTKFMSWKPDPLAIAVDAMSENWAGMYFYAFPPFNMIGKVLQKIEYEGCTGIVVVPYWATQSWWPKFLSMCSECPLVLFSRDGTQRLTHPWRNNTELPKMTLVAGRISDSNTQGKELRGKVWTF